MLPSVERFERGAARAGLRSTEPYAFGRDYAETLRRWRTAYHATAARSSALGLDTHFMRIWDMYFAYCEAAFDEGRTDVVQFHLHKS
jgi:cyclopropane-fatty-acyl-phospholipid synthase